MFRGKESSNRIELSRLVQDLLNFWCFGLPAALGRGQVGGGASGGMGGVPTHTHMHVHACTRRHAHLYMYRNCKWPPTWGHPCLACLPCLTCMCMYVCMHVHAYMHGTFCHTTIPTPTPIHPSATPPGGWTPRII